MIVTHDREQYNIVVCDGTATGVVTLSKQNTAICPTIDHPSTWIAAQTSLEKETTIILQAEKFNYTLCKNNLVIDTFLCYPK